MNKLEFRKLIREEIRKVMKEAKYKPGFKGVDVNDYIIVVVDGPYMSVEDVTKAIKTKYRKAADILRDKDFMFDLEDTDPYDVDGFYLVKSAPTGKSDPVYGGSGYSIANGEDIMPL